MFAGSAAHAQTLTWDVNGATAGTGGTGAWDETSALWFNGATFQPWSNVALDDAIFGGTAGTVTLAAPITAQTLSFVVGGYTLTGDTLSFGGVTPSITTGAGVTTINAPLTGATGFDVNGAGALALGGNSTGYTGVTTVNASTLQVNSASALGTSTAAANLVLNNGATFIFGADFTHNYTLTGGVVNVQGGGAFTWSGAPTLTAATTLNFNSLLSVATVSGDLSDTGGNVLSLTRNGTGVLTLTGTNTYSGGTTITAGTLQLGNGGTTGSIVGDVVDNGALIVNRSNTVTLDGDISGAGTFSQIGAGTTTLTGANTFTGGTIISAGTLQLGNGGTAGSIVGDIADGGTLIVDRSNAVTLDGGISGAGTFSQVGAGTTTLSGVNTFTGGATISAGTLQIGAGGATGSLAGNVANAGALTFNRSGALTFAGMISGNGALNQIGPGATTLTGDSGNFNGDTMVTDGALFVDGDLGAAATTLSVSNGATLGGTGNIGGSVVITDGVLAPGDSPGTLTIAGDLSLAAASTLDYELGAANVVGGPLNDLTVVGGDLVLDGTLNVTESTGGVYGPGLYRVISYGGTLTDNGLDLGTMPVASLNFVQTAVAQQVNLVNSAGLTLNYWDGAAGIRNNGAIEGGAGIWGLDNDNWTQADGAINAPYTDASFAVFAGAPGIVTVDDSLGPITISGMQFASTGYRIEGGALTLIDAVNIIRVGDGTAPGADYVATVASELTGPGSIDLTDLGTLVLTADNTYAGGTTISAGTLQLGDGGTTGAVLGDIVDNGVLAFDRSDDLTFAAVISGSGAMAQRGTGTLTLTGANTYTGGTTISAGTLQVGNGGITGSIVGDVLDNSVLVLNRSDAVTLAGDISGTGELQQIGAGELTLTGANTYTGGTTIGVGSLQIGNGGATGSIVGDVDNGGVLAFNRTGTLTMAGVISGAGSVEQRGAGVTILTGANAYTGGATILDGTLQVGDGGTTGSIVGDVIDDGVLAFDRSDAVIFDGVISGGGELEQNGDGALTLTGNSAAFAGHTAVNAGTLIVNNVLGGTMSVLDGGRLQGIGIIGTTDVASGGTLAAGAPFGTLTIDGDVSFAPGSTYEVGIDADTNTATLLHVLGAANINGGSVSVAGGAYQIGDRYTILTADAGRFGTFTDAGMMLPLLDVSLAYDANNVFLDINGLSTTFCDLGASKNQCAAFSAFATMDPTSPVYIAALSAPDVIAAQEALDAISGEAFASERTMRVESSRYLRDAIFDHASGGFEPWQSGRGRNVWIQAFGAVGNQSSDGNAARVHGSTNGMLAGADASVSEHVRLGIAGGISQSDADVHGRSSTTASDDYHLALYGDARFGAMALRFGAAHSWHDVSSNRRVVFTDFADVVSGDYNARTAQIFAEAGYDLAMGETALEPFVRVAQVRVSTDGFTETGGPSALTVSRDEQDVTFATVGVHAAQSFSVSDWAIIARGTVGWRTASGDLTPLSTNSIAGSDAFEVSGVAIADDAWVLDAGVDVNLAENVALGLSYNYQSSSDAIAQGARINLSMRF